MRLPVYPAPVDGELLSSYVLRLADANTLSPGQLTEVLGLGNFWKRDPDLSVSAQDIAVVEGATGHELRSLDLILFPTAAPLPVPPRLLVDVGRTNRTRGLPVCPLCLREGQGFRVYWRLATHVICERHGCELIDRCPGCAASIKHAQRRGTVKGVGQCHACQQPFPTPASPQEERARPFLYLQALMEQALTNEQVEWGGVTLTREDIESLLYSLILLFVPDDAPLREPTRRFEGLVVQARSRVLVEVAEVLANNLVTCLWRLRERGIRNAQLCIRSARFLHGCRTS